MPAMSRALRQFFLAAIAVCALISLYLQAPTSAPPRAAPPAQHPMPRLGIGEAETLTRFSIGKKTLLTTKISRLLIRKKTSQKKLPLRGRNIFKQYLIKKRWLLRGRFLQKKIFAPISSKKRKIVFFKLSL